ncbi:(d)CMP kinase [Candidatus Daviesbacteria bacterium]|nr:(d)CMP kinase [Candidatus Daviesbacteria bacterium]
MEDIVTIDGPTSSGKNSVGFLLSQKLGYKYIDTGMIYRAGCLKMLQQNISVNNQGKILEIYKNLDVKFETNHHWKMFLDGVDVTDALHTPEISKLVPIVSAFPQVREVMRGIQRKLGQIGKIVMGGRDIGSEIFPEAKFKFFLTASVETRSQRRYKQLHKKDQSIKYEDVLADMVERDKKDSERKASPMRIPEGAVVFDNTNLNIDETVSKILGHIKNYAQTN